jgi:hypothetical protein
LGDRSADDQISLPADGFVTYDELSGPGLDPARWSPARLPLPAGGEHIPLDPNAELTVAQGEVRVSIPRFSLSHDTFQPADSPKYLIFSTRPFELPPGRPATFAVDLAVENIGGNPEELSSHDYRRGDARSALPSKRLARASRRSRVCSHLRQTCAVQHSCNELARGFR